jgi:hypothetical protein
MIALLDLSYCVNEHVVCDNCLVKHGTTVGTATKISGVLPHNCSYLTKVHIYCSLRLTLVCGQASVSLRRLPSLDQ